MITTLISLLALLICIACVLIIARMSDNGDDE